ncbi:MAG: DUF4190 domain-containing protein [Candidatus Saccharimonas sp.]
MSQEPTSTPQSPASQVSATTGKGLAIASLVLGILAILTSIVFGGILGIVAIILGAIALKKRIAKGMSIAGIVTGALGVLGTITTIVVVALIVPSLQADTKRQRDVDLFSSQVRSYGLYTGNLKELPTLAQVEERFTSNWTVTFASSGEPTTDTAVYTTGKNCSGTEGTTEYQVRVLLASGKEYCKGS